MLRKLWSVGKHLRGWSEGDSGKQHLKASCHIIRDQYLGDLWRFTIRAFPESLVLKLKGPPPAYPFFFRERVRQGQQDIFSLLETYMPGQVQSLAWGKVSSFPRWCWNSKSLSATKKNKNPYTYSVPALQWFKVLSKRERDGKRKGEGSIILGYISGMCF